MELHQLHHTKTTTVITLHRTTTSSDYPYNCNYNCATPRYVQQLWMRWPTRWPLPPLRPFHKNTTPTSCRSITGSALPSFWFTRANISHRFPILEMFAIVLCRTTGNPIYNHRTNPCMEWFCHFVPQSNTMNDMLTAAIHPFQTNKTIPCLER